MARRRSSTQSGARRTQRSLKTPKRTKSLPTITANNDDISIGTREQPTNSFPRPLPANFSAPAANHFRGDIFMSGALGEGAKRGKLRASVIATLNAAVCRKEEDQQFIHQPFRMINKSELRTRIIFNDPAQYDKIPEDFLTTNLGLKRAAKFYSLIARHGRPGDESTMLAISGVAGCIRHDKRHNRVHYPEDMVPHPALPEHIDLRYWEEIAAQGRIWTEMPPIVRFQQVPDPNNYYW